MTDFYPSSCMGHPAYVSINKDRYKYVYKTSG